VVETPNLDVLARRGTVFTRAYSTCPSCIAARCSLLTGLTPNSHGRIGYRDCVPWDYPDMLPEVLARNGYQTHCVGKMHVYPQTKCCGFQSVEHHEADQRLETGYVDDYERFVVQESNGRFTYDATGLNCNAMDARPSVLPEDWHNNTWVVTRGIDFLRRRNPTHPFFLKLSFHRPHPPLDPPEAYWNLFQDRELPPVPVGDWANMNDEPSAWIDTNHGRFPSRMLDRARRAYYAQIAHIDRQIGRFLQACETQKVPMPTILFTSDHGEMLGDHYLYRKMVGYEGSARIPLILFEPANRQRRDHFVSAPVAIEDIYPTICEIAEIEIPRHVEGRSLMPLHRGEKVSWREFIHGEHTLALYHTGDGMQFLTDGREKYLWHTISGKEQLFDLVQDPTECHDLAANETYAGHLALWRNRLVEILTKRPEDGLCDGQHLLPGKDLPPVKTWLLQRLGILNTVT